MTPSSAGAALRDAALVAFDFDGTLVDSNPIKLRAFDQVFSEFSAEADEIRRYCHAHHHTPRWEKFRHVYQNILHRAYTPEIETDLSARYEALTTDAIVRAREIAGGWRLVTAVSRSRPVGLLSSTPDAVIREILKRKDWLACFDEVKGAPVVKAEWLDSFARSKGIPGRKALYFGDSEEDRRSAETAGWMFVGVANPRLSGAGVPFIPDFDSLSKTPGLL